MSLPTRFTHLLLLLALLAVNSSADDKLPAKKRTEAGLYLTAAEAWERVYTDLAPSAGASRARGG